MPQRRRRKTVDGRVRRTIWDGSFEGWTVKFLRSNFWRVESTMEWEDAMQECKTVFVHVCRKYEGRNDGPKHMMGIYQVALANWWNVLSSRDTKRRNMEFLYTSEEAMEAADATTVGELDNDGAMVSMVTKLPSDVRDVIRILYDAPADVLELVCSSIRTGKRERKANAELCELTGDDPDRVNLVDKLRGSFSQS